MAKRLTCFVCSEGLEFKSRAGQRLSQQINLRSNEMVHKTMKYEQFSIYLFLFFIFFT